MSKRQENQALLPVLLGGDLNCYSVARAFYEEYGVKSHVFGKNILGVTQHSRFLTFTVQPNLGDAALCVKILRDFAAEHADRALVLMGCTDEYAAFLISHRDELSDVYHLPYMDAELMPSLVDKADFYQSCERYGIPYPKTAIFAATPEVEALTPEVLGFAYPLIVKPSSSIDYWHHEFPGMKKVYTAHDPEEAHAIIRQIYASGYPKRMIVQDMIPGGDSHMRVLTAYSDQHRRVKMMCIGHVLLEEHTPRGLGNHAAIITEPLPDVAKKIEAMLNDMGVQGFTNFDLKMDDRDGQLKAFEINLRQGRSNHYLTAAGINVARLVTEDRVFGRELPNIREGKRIFWHSVPKKAVYRYVEDDTLAKEAKALAKAGAAASPLVNSHDLRWNFRRLAFVTVHLRRHHGKFAAYCRRYR